MHYLAMARENIFPFLTEMKSGEYNLHGELRYLGQFSRKLPRELTQIAQPTLYT